MAHHVRHNAAPTRRAAKSLPCHRPLLAFDQFGNFPPENIGDRSSVAAHGVSISDSFRVFGIANANGNQLERRDLSVRTGAQSQVERDPVKSGFDVLDQGNSLYTFD